MLFEEVDGHVLAFVPVHEVGPYLTFYEVAHGLSDHLPVLCGAEFHVGSFPADGF